jgi:hypothetical protein
MKAFVSSTLLFFLVIPSLWAQPGDHRMEIVIHYDGKKSHAIDRYDLFSNYEISFSLFKNTVTEFVPELVPEPFPEFFRALYSELEDTSETHQFPDMYYSSANVQYGHSDSHLRSSASFLETLEKIKADRTPCEIGKGVLFDYDLLDIKGLAIIRYQTIIRTTTGAVFAIQFKQKETGKMMNIFFRPAYLWLWDVGISDISLDSINFVEGNFLYDHCDGNPSSNYWDGKMRTTFHSACRNTKYSKYNWDPRKNASDDDYHICLSKQSLEMHKISIPEMNEFLKNCECIETEEEINENR